MATNVPGGDRPDAAQSLHSDAGTAVMPAKAGIQSRESAKSLDCGMRRDDKSPRPRKQGPSRVAPTPAKE
jgi:hypothetical protein